MPNPFYLHLLSKILLFSLLLLSFSLLSERLPSSDNGFDLSDTSISREQFLQGGPPRDGIPALTEPSFVSAKHATFLSPKSRVIGVSLNAKSKAYPIAILNYHEIVNDELGGMHLTITFCPLCGTGIAYNAKVGNDILEFGVSGLLYNSDVLLYDRLTESLWSQMLSKAVSGPMKGKQLNRVPAQHTTWQSWQHKHPDTQVLSLSTGHRRNYQKNPYGGYDESNTVYFPVTNSDPRYHNKEVVLTLEINGHIKAYPFVELARFKKIKGVNHLQDIVAGQEIIVEFELESRSGRIMNVKGVEIPSFQAFWFAWIAFHPNSEVFTAKP
ncbi:MAG: DUF3179 domain-containing protein [Colwellia sp.]